MKRKFKVVLSWITIGCIVFLLGTIIYEFLRYFNYPWAYALVLGGLSYFLYWFIEE